MKIEWVFVQDMFAQNPVNERLHPGVATPVVRVEALKKEIEALADELEGNGDRRGQLALERLERRLASLKE